MKNLIVFLCSLALIFLVPEGARALSFTDTTIFNSEGTDPSGDLDGYGGEYVNRLEGFGDYISWTHHFGFDPPAVSITSANLEVDFEDDDTDRWCWIFPIDHELGIGWGEDWSFDFGEIDTGTVGPYSLNVSYLTDGLFSATVASAGGDFIIRSSRLTINYEGAAPVPEPSTILLMGAGLLGLVAVGRRKLNRKK